MEKIAFEANKERIRQALDARLKAPGSTQFLGEQGFTLIDGFFNQSFQKELPGIMIGGQALPMVAIVGNTTGRVYFFALKSLLPDIQL
jgi:hypothetical protein